MIIKPAILPAAASKNLSSQSSVNFKEIMGLNTMLKTFLWAMEQSRFLMT